jgi:hypothetical protein
MPMPAPILSVQIQQSGDNAVLVISGEMPDPCHEVGEVVQRVEDSSIYVDVEMTPPAPDMVCAQVITPYTVEVPIDVRLEPGEYTVIANDNVIEITVK